MGTAEHTATSRTIGAARQRSELDRVVRRLRRWWPIGVLLVALATGLGWAAGHLVTTLEVMGLVAAGVTALVVLRRRPEARTRSATADPSLLAAVQDVLDGLDPIEHRSLRLDALWPQVTVGPTGVLIVDVCELHGPLQRVGDAVVARRSGQPSQRAARVAELATRLRAELVVAELAAPVRAVLVVRDDAELPDDEPAAARRRREPVVVSLASVPVDRLAATISRGEVLPMAQVERVFHALAATVVAHGR